MSSDTEEASGEEASFIAPAAALPATVGGVLVGPVAGLGMLAAFPSAASAPASGAAGEAAAAGVYAASTACSCVLFKLAA